MVISSAANCASSSSAAAAAHSNSSSVVLHHHKKISVSSIFSRKVAPRDISLISKRSPSRSVISMKDAYFLYCCSFESTNSLWAVLILCCLFVDNLFESCGF